MALVEEVDTPIMGAQLPVWRVQVSVSVDPKLDGSSPTVSYCLTIFC